MIWSMVHASNKDKNDLPQNQCCIFPYLPKKGAKILLPGITKWISFSGRKKDLSRSGSRSAPVR